MFQIPDVFNPKREIYPGNFNLKFSLHKFPPYGGGGVGMGEEEEWVGGERGGCRLGGEGGVIFILLSINNG